MQPTNPDMPSDRLFSVLLDVVLFFRSVVVQVLPSLVIVFTVRSLPIWTRFMVAHLCFMQVNHGIAVPLFLKRCTICSFPLFASLCHDAVSFCLLVVSVYLHVCCICDCGEHVPILFFLARVLLALFSYCFYSSVGIFPSASLQCGVLPAPSL